MAVNQVTEHIDDKQGIAVSLRVKQRNELRGFSFLTNCPREPDSDVFCDRRFIETM